MVRTPKGARLRRAEKRERARVNWTGVRRKEKPKKSITCRAVGDLRFSEVNFVLSSGVLVTRVMPDGAAPQGGAGDPVSDPC